MSVKKTNRLLKEIAKKHGVSVEEVRRDMESALETAYAALGIFAFYLYGFWNELKFPYKSPVSTLSIFLANTANKAIAEKRAQGVQRSSEATAPSNTFGAKPPVCGL